MKSLIKLNFVCGMLLATSSFASDLAWDDMKVVPAIKIESNKYLSCKKEYSLNKQGVGQKVSPEYYEKDYFCLNKNDDPVKPIYFTTQQLAKEYIGNVKAVGVMSHKMENKPGQYTVENVYVDLYYKNK